MLGKKVMILVLIVLMVWPAGIYHGKAAPEKEVYINSYYALSSYAHKDYARISDQVALGWSEIRKKGDEIYFSQQKQEALPMKSFDYGVPAGDIPGLVNEMKKGGASLKLSIFLGNTDILREILDSVEIQQKIINEITESFVIPYYYYDRKPDYNGNYPCSTVVDSNGKPVEYDGIILDFEGLYDKHPGSPGTSYSQKFNEFLDRIRLKMPARKTLTVCLHPKRGQNIPYFDGYDYSHIGMVADEVILMAHNYETRDGSIRASAPYSYVKEAVEFAIAEIPPEKILLQVGANVVQWTEGKGRSSVSYDSMVSALEGRNPDQVVVQSTPREKRFDQESGVGYAYLKRDFYKDRQYQYTQIDHFYFENQRSLKLKEDMVREYGLKGLSIWRLGLGSWDFWDYIFRGRMLDLNGDGTINTGDLTAGAAAYGAREGMASWNPGFDINRDNKVNILDLVRVARYINPGAHTGVSGGGTIPVADPVVSASINTPGNIELWDEFELEIKLSKVNDFYGASVDIVYDPNIIRVVDIVPENIFGIKEPLAVEAVKRFDNNKGTLEYVRMLTSDTGGVRADRTFAKIRFKAVLPGTFKFSMTQDGAVDLSLLGVNMRVSLVDSYGMPISRRSAASIEKAVWNIKNSVISKRLYGNDRFATAAAISREGWAASDVVLLATGAGENTFADALAGAPLAALLDAPVLLTGAGYIPEATLKEINRLKAKTVYILGGPGAVSEEVEMALTKSGLKVERLWGQNRFGTAAAIMEEFIRIRTAGGAAPPSKVFLTTGMEFPYALCIAPFGGVNGIPILFTAGSVIPEDTLMALNRQKITEVEIVGGTNVVPAQVEQQLVSMGINVTRLGGKTATDTAVSIAHQYGSGKSAAIARDDLYVDALAGAALAAKDGTPILLVKPKEAPAPVLDYMAQNSHALSRMYVFGGTGAVEDNVWYNLINQLKKTE